MKNRNNFINNFFIIIGCLCVFFMIILSFWELNTVLQQNLKLEAFSFNKSSRKDRTIMIYMIGSNLESRSEMATIDVKEIEKSMINLNDNNVVIYAGGTKEWHNHFENNSIYELTDEGFVLVSKDKDSSMGESDTLTRFLNYVQKNYDSEKYGLIFWDHGAGPIEGYGYDEVYDGDSLQLTEMKQAFSDSGYSSNNKFEFVAFDTCLMASIEVAHVVSEFSDYMIASQDLEPEYGWDYSFMSEIHKGISTETIGRFIIDYANLFYSNSLNFEEPKKKFDVTLSMLDLTKIEDLEKVLNNLFLNVDVFLIHDNYSEVVSKITRAHPFGYFGFESSYDLVDLYCVAEQLKDNYPEQSELLQKKLSEIIIYQKSNVEGANGISIYYPYYTKKYLNEYLGIYNELNFAENYTNFLLNYSKLLLEDNSLGLNIQTLTPTFSQEQKNMQVLLDETTINQYNRANYIVLRKMESGNYMPVYKSSDVTLQENGFLIANVEKKQLNVMDSKGNIGWASMFEYSEMESSTVYLVPITLYQFEKNGLDIQLMDNAYIKLLVNQEHPNGTIINVIPMSHIDNVSSMKTKINLQEWDSIQFFNFEYEIYDAQNRFQVNWMDFYNTNTIHVKSDDKYKLEFNEFDENYDYYALFEIEDTYGNVYYTNLTELN